MATDLLGGQIDLAVMVLSSALPHIQAGRVRAYGVTEAKRAGVAPNVPALAETPALKGVDMGVWFGLMAPTSTPRPIIDRLNTEMQAVLAMPDVRKKLAEAGVEVAPANPAQFASFVKRETAKYRAIVQAADIRE
jgi:tripartite-type tricarboxylate transporter receptor subunit TctC